MSAAATARAVEPTTKAEPRVVVRFEEWMLGELKALARDAYEESEVMKAFPYSESRVEDVIATAIFSPERVCGFACIDMEQKKILGAMIGAVDGVYWSTEMVANDVIVYVRPEHRDGVVVKRLLDAYVRWAHKLGIRKVFVEQTTGIAPLRTMKFLEHLGWKLVGSKMMKEAA